jgi:hypothetical protein
MDPIARARLALDGLSVGDTFGETFFGPAEKVDSTSLRAKRSSSNAA